MSIPSSSHPSSFLVYFQNSKICVYSRLAQICVFLDDKTIWRDSVRKQEREPWAHRESFNSFQAPPTAIATLMPPLLPQLMSERTELCGTQLSREIPLFSQLHISICFAIWCGLLWLRVHNI